MLSEEKLVELSYKVDEFYAEAASTYDIPLQSLNAVMLARLMRLNMELGSTENFKKLMDSIVTGELTPESKYVQ